MSSPIRAREAVSVSKRARDAAKVASNRTDLGRDALYLTADLAEIVSELAHELEYVWAILAKLDPAASTDARADYSRDMLARIQDRVTE